MATRKGMMKGKGRGYKNVIGKDPYVHSQSARGIKQPQRLSMSQKIAITKHLRYKDTDKDGVGNKMDCRPFDPTKQDDLKTFQVKDGVEIVAHFEDTRSGFRHIAVLYVDGIEVDRAKATYQNRTWERYEFETVMSDLLDKTNILSDAEKKDFLDNAQKRNKAELDEKFGTIGAIAKMGELIGSTQEEKNDWKKRMLKAGLQLDVPEDWDTLSESEKEKRLDKVISFMQKGSEKKQETPKQKKVQIVQREPFSYELKPLYDSRGSFGGKAKVEDDGQRKTLISYSTEVAYIDKKTNKPVVKGTYSQTTTRHIKEFLKQNGFFVDTTKQILEDYGQK